MLSQSLKKARRGTILDGGKTLDNISQIAYLFLCNIYYHMIINVQNGRDTQT